MLVQEQASPKVHNELLSLFSFVPEYSLGLDRRSAYKKVLGIY